MGISFSRFYSVLVVLVGICGVFGENCVVDREI